jgi:2'-5' RNA ligase
LGRQTVIAYWLIPSEPSRSFFQAIISNLARRYDAPAFEPHVTIHVGADCADATKHALADAAHQCKRIKLKPLRIGQSEELIKTLFVEFAMTAALRRIDEVIRNALHDSSQYELKPHLSLIYKKMAAETRRELAASIKVALRELTFGSLKAVRCISPTQRRADVEAWRVIAEASLSG